MAGKTQKKKGGSCAPMSTSQYGAAVYGAADQQHAGANGAIAMNVPPVVGGGKKSKKEKGGSTFADLAVPAVLLYASTALRKTKSNRRGGRKNRSYKRRR